jgi:hypothetical protein
MLCKARPEGRGTQDKDFSPTGIFRSDILTTSDSGWTGRTKYQGKKVDVRGCPLKESNPAIEPVGGHPI